MSTLRVTNIQHESAASPTITLASNGTATVSNATLTGATLTNPTLTLQSENVSPYSGFRNRLINSDMRIDQRNAGASVSGTVNVYTVDRWKVQNNSGSARFNVQQNVGSVTPPTGFKNYLGITSTGAYSVAASDVIGIQQMIEGFNTADFGWGASGAATITLSFWVRSSLTGTFGGSILEGNAASASYPFTYTINSANTWEQKTVTVVGPTIGTWQTGISTSIQLLFNMGTGSTYLGAAGAWSGGGYYGATGQTNLVATNGATFYLTGVQLEKGTVATPFEFRSFGQELALCQRYYQSGIGAGAFGACRVANSSTAIFVPWATTMRASPTYSLTSSSITFAVPGGANYTYTGASPESTGADSTTSSFLYINGSSTVSVGTLSFLYSGKLNLNAEL